MADLHLKFYDGGRYSASNARHLAQDLCQQMNLTWYSPETTAFGFTRLLAVKVTPSSIEANQLIEALRERQVNLVAYVP